MSLQNDKLKLIQMIIATEDESTIRKVMAYMKDEHMSVAEQQADYGVEDESAVRLEDLSPELQESIKRGLAQLERGEGIPDEVDEKYRERWFEEN